MENVACSVLRVVHLVAATMVPNKKEPWWCCAGRKTHQTRQCAEKGCDKWDQDTAYRYWGWGREWHSGLLRLTHPTTHQHPKIFLRNIRGKMQFIKEACHWRSILGTHFFFAFGPPPLV